MKVLRNTLNTIVEVYEDPGDYPSGAGGYPLPDRPYVEGFTGSLLVEVLREELEEAGLRLHNLPIYLEADEGGVLAAELPSGVDSVTEWDILRIGGNFPAVVQDVRISWPNAIAITVAAFIVWWLLPWWLTVIVFALTLVGLIIYANATTAIYHIEIVPAEWESGDIEPDYDEYDYGDPYDYDDYRDI